MDENTAKLHLKVKDDEDIDDVWEQKLFEQKQFFLTRPPISKVFKARLKKLFKVYEAYLFLSGKILDNEILVDDQLNQSFNFSNYIKEAFNQLQQRRMQIKSKVLNAKHPNELSEVIESWLTIEKDYMRKWLIDFEIDSSEITISKELDPMYLLDYIEKAEDFIGKKLTFEFLKNNPEAVPKELKLEMYRLNLLYEKSE